MLILHLVYLLLHTIYVHLLYYINYFNYLDIRTDETKINKNA